MVAIPLNVYNFINNWFENIKTGQHYYVTNYCINTTNDRDGKIMLIYQKLSELKKKNVKIFCRELHEFNQKFKLINL